VEEFRIPIVVTGFEPVDLLEGILMVVTQLEEGRYEVENQYVRSVRRSGNLPAREILGKVFRKVDREWRGVGVIPRSGLALREELRGFDAEVRFPSPPLPTSDEGDCRAGEVLQGRLKPLDCPSFRTLCTPERPLGAPMVSSEGACAAYYRSGRHRALESLQ
jgi:hydrogenase expression/formation protein HypD